MLYLTREEARAYLRACSPWYRPLAEVLIGAGLRIGEAVAVEWRDVDWDASALRIARTIKHGGIGSPKGDRSRNVLLPSYLLDLLHAHRLNQAGTSKFDRLVFTTSVGTMLNRHNVRVRGHRPTIAEVGLSPA